MNHLKTSIKYRFLMGLFAEICRNPEKFTPLELVERSQGTQFTILEPVERSQGTQFTLLEPVE
ncbi:MAG: hypothetical protein RRY23_07180, partial [Alistipes sp.]